MASEYRVERGPNWISIVRSGDRQMDVRVFTSPSDDLDEAIELAGDVMTALTDVAEPPAEKKPTRTRKSKTAA